MNKRAKKYILQNTKDISLMVQSRVKGELEDKGMTQRELGRKLGISEFSVSRKLNEDRNFTLTEMVAMAYATGLKVSVHLEDL